jgi:hypothetical protein
VGRARFVEPEQRAGLLWAGLGSAILLHGSYDAFLFTSSGYALLAVVVLFIEVHWGRKLYKALQAEQVVGSSMLAEPVLAGPVVVVESQGRVAQGGWTSGPAAMAEPVQVAAPELLASAAQAVVAVHRTRPSGFAFPRREPERTFWSWAKLAMGGVGLSLCSLWWLAVAAITFFPDAPRDPTETLGLVILALFSAIPTVLCGLLFRSGLRGPFEPALAN